VASFVWNKNFITGISDVDEQHQGLVDLINAFGDHVAAGDMSSAELSDIVDRLRNYARFHFREEETLMEAGGIDPRALEAHRHAHQKFCDEVEYIAAQVTRIGKKESRHVLEYLVHWLGYHILGIDQSMARQLRAIDSGVSPARAYDDEQNVDAGPVQPLLDAISGLLRVVEGKNRELQDINAALEERVAERTRELQDLSEAMNRLAMHDPLTGLPNRRRAMNFLEAQWPAKEVHTISCIMIDADHFKEINDQFGHDEGDNVLKALAADIHQGFRTDDLVCRLGGDEFLAICPKTSLSTALELARDLLKRIDTLTIPVLGGQWRGSLSIGVAASMPDMKTPVDLLRSADEGLYAAKAAGRDTVCTTQQLTLSAAPASIHAAGNSVLISNDQQ
jgi:hemerythrin